MTDDVRLEGLWGHRGRGLLQLREDIQDIVKDYLHDVATQDAAVHDPDEEAALRLQNLELPRSLRHEVAKCVLQRVREAPNALILRISGLLAELQRRGILSSHIIADAVVEVLLELEQEIEELALDEEEEEEEESAETQQQEGKKAAGAAGALADSSAAKASAASVSSSSPSPADKLKAECTPRLLLLLTSLHGHGSILGGILEPTAASCSLHFEALQPPHTHSHSYSHSQSFDHGYGYGQGHNGSRKAFFRELKRLFDAALVAETET